MKIRAALVACSLGLSACAAHQPGTRSDWLPAYALGAIGGGQLDLRDHCPRGAVHELSVGSSWATLAVALATLGVYTPREVRVRCAVPR